MFSRKRFAVGLGFAALLGIGWVVIARTSLTARYAEYSVRTAPNDTYREAAVNTLFDCEDEGTNRIACLLRGDDANTCRAIATVLGKRDDAAGPLWNQIETFSRTGQAAFVRLAATEAQPEAGRTAIRAALAGTDRDLQLAAIRLACRPKLNLAAEMLPMLKNADATIRVAALTLIGQSAAAVTRDEDLFPWLNDSDAEVRQTCEAVLLTRGRSDEEIAFGRRLSHSSVTERLKLLLELAAVEGVDVGPWLERLSRDPSPAVRAGAARVAVELKLPFLDWVKAMALNDPDAAVRQVAGYYRSRGSDIRPAGFTSSADHRP